MNTSALNDFFVVFWNTASGNIGGTVVAAVTPIAQGILAVLFILSVYEAFAQGGGPRALIVNVLKCAACSLIIQNWTKFFQDFSNGFTSIAAAIQSAGDPVATYWSQIGSLNPDNGGWGAVLSLSAISILNDCVVILTVILYVICVWLFSYFYVAWGLVLMGIGPFMVALYPSRATSGFTKHFIQGAVAWASWPILYAVIGNAIISIQGPNGGGSGNPMSSLPNSGMGIGVAVAGQINSAMVGILMIIMMVLIPFLATYILKADFGGVAQAIKTAAQLGKYSGLSSAGKALLGEAKGGAAAIGNAMRGGGGGAGGGGGQSFAPGGSPTGGQSTWSAGGSTSGGAAPPPATPSSGSGPSWGGKSGTGPSQAGSFTRATFSSSTSTAPASTASNNAPSGSWGSGTASSWRPNSGANS